MSIPDNSDKLRVQVDDEIITLIRESETMAPDVLEKMFSDEHVADTVHQLKKVRRDIDVQYEASAARIHDFRARCAIAKMNGDTIRVQVDDRDNRSWAEHEPDIALDLFLAKEARWKVRTMRFQYLIDDAVLRAENVWLGEPGNKRIRLLLEAVDEHRKDLADDADDADLYLYKVADELRAASA